MSILTTIIIQIFLFAFICSIMLLSISYILFKLFSSLRKCKELQKVNTLYEQQLNLCEQQMVKWEKEHREIKDFRHDMKNHFTTLGGLIQNGTRLEAMDYLNEISDFGKINPSVCISHTGNITVDSLINHKYSLAMKENIDFKSTIHIPSVMTFKSIHISIIIGNILDNALDACYTIKYNHRYINFEMLYEKGLLSIIVQNPYHGKRLHDQNNNYQTTKEKQKHHGYGLKSVQAVTDYYKGDTYLESKDGVFYTKVILYEPFE